MPKHQTDGQVAQGFEIFQLALRRLFLGEHGGKLFVGPSSMRGAEAGALARS